MSRAALFAASATFALAACSSQSPAKAPQGQFAEAVFAGGCFWCTEADFDEMPGVVSTTSGYTGGRTANPSYDQVSAGATGHIEAVRVVYDPRKITYPALVHRFLRTIDVTDGGGQFCDRGESYRPAIFVGSPQQRRISQAALVSAERQIGEKTDVALLPAARFWAAEDYHQDYYQKNPVRYKFYRWNCGRDQRLKQIWG
jgi:peptide-methionine (S)-S-oxide reductase